MTTPTQEEIKRNALRFAGNAWRRYKAYVTRFMKKYGKTASKPRAEVFFNNRMLEDSYARLDGPNPLPHGKHMAPRQRLADSLLQFRAVLDDPSEFDAIYGASLARRMPGYIVTITRAMSASEENPEKDTIRTFVKKIR